MHTKPSRTFIAGVFAASLLLAGFGVGALQQGTSRVQPATAIAVVDFSKVLDALQEPKDRDADRRARAQQLTEELNRDKERLLKLEEEINKMKADTPEWRDMVLRGLQESAALRARQETHQAFLDREKLEFLREIYAKVSETVNRIAKRDGWEIVIIDDRSIRIPPTEAGRNSIDAAIASKRVIFAAERVDLTSQVITQMNNEYQAARRN